MKKKILVVFTGGTIGSSVVGHTINPAVENQFKLLSLYQKHFQTSVSLEFVTLAPLEILSENLVPADWEKLITVIAAVDQTDLAGIIVTHGTDTLAFTACALSLYFADIKLPLVMVSSDYPLTDTRANGLSNFHTAITFIQDRSEAGVFVAYKNAGEQAFIHLGTRVVSSLQLGSNFYSVQFKPYLAFTDESFRELNPPSPLPASIDRWSFKPIFSKQILLIKPYPGLDYRHFNLDGVQAVLQDTYHSGTACSTAGRGEHYSCLNFIKRCQIRGVHVYLAPVLASPDLYGSSRALIEAGVTVLWSMSLEVAYVKLALAYANIKDNQSRIRYLQQNIAHEILEVGYS